MAYVTKAQQEGKSMADEEPPANDPERDLPDARDEEPDDADVRPSSRSAPKPERGQGFFTIYKQGQGYWTRMGTAIGIAVIALFTGYNLYVYVPIMLPRPVPLASMSASEQGHFFSQIDARNHEIAMVIGVGVAAGLLLLGWWLSNTPDHVDFLIATDSEMKKVNWTSRKELIGSTRIVIIFMFSVAIFLFLVDIVFGYLFYVIHVLRNSPFGS